MNKKWLPLFALVLASGCELVRACTLLPCLNGLMIGFTTKPTIGYRVEVRTPGFSGAVHVVECAQPNNCTDPYFQDFFPQTAEIKVITATGTTTTTVTPEYKESQPNGKGCGPTCRQAQVTVAPPP